jgi:hypothetical protein
MLPTASPPPPSGGSAGNRTPVGPVHGEFRTTYVRRSRDYYEYAATFWAKSKPPIFGVIVEGSGTEAPATEGARGVVVHAVIHDSPAARAGIHRDDVVVRFSGTEIVTPDQFFDTVVANKGRKVEAEIVRVPESRVIRVELQLQNE